MDRTRHICICTRVSSCLARRSHEPRTGRQGSVAAVQRVQQLLVQSKVRVCVHVSQHLDDRESRGERAYELPAVRTRTRLSVGREHAVESGAERAPGLPGVRARRRSSVGPWYACAGGVGRTSGMSRVCTRPRLSVGPTHRCKCGAGRTLVVPAVRARQRVPLGSPIPQRTRSAGGHLECLRYAHDNGCPWNERTIAYPSYYGHLACLEYAHEHGCPWNELTSQWAAGQKGGRVQNDRSRVPAVEIDLARRRATGIEGRLPTAVVATPPIQ